MELANIEKLVEKYLNAETSLKEEKILREYFTSNKVAPHLQQMSSLFGYFKENQSETYLKPIKLKPKKAKKKNLKWKLMAASVALLITVFIGKQEYKKHQQKKQFAEIKKALEMVSFNLNKGNDALYAVSDNLTKGNNAIQQLNTFPKTINTANNILKTNK